MKHLYYFVYTADVDYNSLISPSELTLSDNVRLTCTRVLISEDLLVEGQESLTVHSVVDSYKGSYIISGSSTTHITILDSNGKCS